MSLKTRTTLSLLVPVLGCLGLFGSFAYAQMRDSILDARLEQLESIADLKVNQVERLIATYRHDTRVANEVVAELFGRNGPNPGPEAIAKVLDRLLASNEEIAALHVMDPDGKAIGSTVSEMVGTVAGAGLGPFDSTSVVEAGVAIRPFLMDASSLPRTVVLSPIVTEDRYVGLFVVRFRVASLRIAIETGLFSDTGELLLAMRDEDGNARFLTDVLQVDDAEGQILALSDREDVPMIRALAGFNQGWTDGMRDYAGNEVIAVTRYLEELDWGLVAGIDRAEALGPVRALRFVLISLALALAVLLVSVGRYLGGRLTETNSRLEGELALRSLAERRLRDVVGSSPSPMLALRVDPYTSVVGGIELANREAQRLLGRRNESLVGWGLDSWLHKDSLAAFGEIASVSLDIGATPEDRPRADILTVHADGSPVEVEVVAVPVELEAGQLLLVTLIDLTERNRVARELQEHAEELARSNRDLDDFAYVASHDLKAPLRAVVQLAGFIEEDAGPSMPAESLADLRLLRGRAERLDRLLAGLLEYSRIGRRESESESIDTAEVLREIVDLYVPDDGFRVVFDGELAPVFAPQAAFHLVLRNLVMNAVKHHDGDSGEIHVSARASGGFVRLTVRDDGPGIPAEYAARVFQLFETLRPRDEVEGNGLGLPMVKKTIESLGGAVEIGVASGRGAVFHVLWPMESRPARTRDAA